jgi:hypothetical protein
MSEQSGLGGADFGNQIRGDCCSRTAQLKTTVAN